MSIAVQRRRGDSTDHANFTGFDGEVTVDTDKKTLVVHDGDNQGGFPMAREDLSNVEIEGTISNLNLAKNDLSNVTADAVIGKGVAKTDLSNINSGLIGSAASKNVGTAAGNVVQLDSSARLPAINASQLTDLPSSVDAKQLCKAFGRVSIAGSLQSGSFNVSSTSLGANREITVNFSSYMLNTNYVVLLTTYDDVNSTGYNVVFPVFYKATNRFKFTYTNGAGMDGFMFAVFGG